MQGSTSADFAMDEFFKLSKLHLAIYGGAYCFQELVKQINFLFVAGVLQGVFQQQDFVGGGSDLCTEDSVICVDVGLGAAGEVAVECVSHFVSNGGDTVVAFLVVKEYEGMHAIYVPRVSTATLAFVFVNINPTFAKTFL